MYPLYVQLISRTEIAIQVGQKSTSYFCQRSIVANWAIIWIILDRYPCRSYVALKQNTGYCLFTVILQLGSWAEG